MASLHASLLHKPFSALTGEMFVILWQDSCPGSRNNVHANHTFCFFHMC